LAAAQRLLTTHLLTTHQATTFQSRAELASGLLLLGFGDAAAKVSAQVEEQYGDGHGGWRLDATHAGDPNAAAWRDGAYLSPAALLVMMLKVEAKGPGDAHIAQALAALAAARDDVQPTAEYCGYWLAAQMTDGLPSAPSSSAAVAHLSAAFAAPLAADQEATLNVTLRIDPPWHAYAHEPGADMYTPTTLTVELPTGFTIKGIEYPAGRTVTADGQTLHVYSDETVLRVSVHAPAPLPDKVSARLTARVQTCTDVNCLRPASASRTVELR
jgi:hypothetical protein